MGTQHPRVTVGRLLALGVALAGLCGHTPRAATTSWTAATADWYTGTNWSAGLPASGDDARIENAGTAQVGTAAATATAANLYLGYSGAPANGYLQVSDGALQVGGLVYLGYPYQKIGTITQTGGAVSATDLVISYNNSFYRIDAGTLNLTGKLQVGGAYSNTQFVQNNGTVTVGGNLQLGATSQGGTNSVTIQNGSLTVGGAVTSLSGPISWTQSGGTVAVTGTLNMGGAAAFTANLSGGTISAGGLVVGDRYNNAASPLFDQRGTDITVTGAVTVRGTNVNYQLRQGTLSVGKSQSLSIGGGDAYGAGPGVFSFNLNATGPTTLTENGAGSGAGLILRQYGTSFGMSRVGQCIGTFRGWGDVGLTGTLNNSGRVIADGAGSDHTLDMSHFTAVANSFDNVAANGATNTGWFAVNHGRLALPGVAVAAGNTTVNWGEAPADATLDLVNSARLAFTGAAAGTLTGRLYAPDHSTLAGFGSYYRPIGIWEFSGPTFTSVDLQFRLDDALLRSYYGFAGPGAPLQFWHGDGTTWQLLTATIDWSTSIASLTGVSSFSSFAIVALPEPGVAALLLLAAAGALATRRGRG